MKPRHVALAVLVATIWGVNFVVIKVGLRDFPPLFFSALRFLAAAPTEPWVATACRARSLPRSNMQRC